MARCADPFGPTCALCGHTKPSGGRRAAESAAQGCSGGRHQSVAEGLTPVTWIRTEAVPGGDSGDTSSPV